MVDKGSFQGQLGYSFFGYFFFQIGLVQGSFLIQFRYFGLVGVMGQQYVGVFMGIIVQVMQGYSFIFGYLLGQLLF